MKTIVVLLAMVASLAWAEVINIHDCSNSDCTFNEVRVIPCPQAGDNAACHIRRRKPTTMSFDYTTNFDAEKLEAAVTWVKSHDQELPLVSMDTDACKYTTCPVESGKKKTYEIEVPIESKFPTGSYTVRWVLKDSNSEKKCCFTTDIKVVR